MLVFKNGILSECRDLTMSLMGCVHQDVFPSLIGPPSMVWIFTGLLGFDNGIFCWTVVAQSKKFPAKLESINGECKD